MRDAAIVIVILIVGLGVIIGVLNREDPQEQMESTEAFIHRWLKNDNGTIATYIQDSGEIDEDLVQGRESLAETVGLWMFYALGEENQALFNEASTIRISSIKAFVETSLSPSSFSFQLTKPSASK